MIRKTCIGNGVHYWDNEDVKDGKFVKWNGLPDSLRNSFTPKGQTLEIGGVHLETKVNADDVDVFVGWLWHNSLEGEMLIKKSTDEGVVRRWVECKASDAEACESKLGLVFQFKNSDYDRPIFHVEILEAIQETLVEIDLDGENYDLVCDYGNSNYLAARAWNTITNDSPSQFWENGRNSYPPGIHEDDEDQFDEFIQCVDDFIQDTIKFRKNHWKSQSKTIEEEFKKRAEKKDWECEVFVGDQEITFKMGDKDDARAADDCKHDILEALEEVEEGREYLRFCTEEYAKYDDFVIHQLR